jgi:sulfur carrier protein
MLVVLNGERMEIAARNLAALLSEREYTHTHVAMAVNQRVVPRAAWGHTALNSGDQIEIVTPRQGG